MDVLDVDTQTLQNEAERPELDPDDAPATLKTITEDVHDMLDAGIIDGRVLKCLAELAAFRSQAILALDAHAKHITDLQTEFDASQMRSVTQLAQINGLEANTSDEWDSVHETLRDCVKKIAEVADALPAAEKRITDLETAATAPSTTTKTTKTPAT